MLLTLFAGFLSLSSTFECVPTTCPDCYVYNVSGDCTERQLTSVPQCLPEFITRLFISVNNISELTSASFITLPNLQEIQANVNQINFIDEDTFVSLPNLKILSMWSNRLVTVTSNLFIGNRNLDYLDISSNKIKSFDTKLIEPIKALRFLNINENDISEIVRDGVFAFESDLSILNLRDNLLTSIDPALFSNVIGLTIYLDQNPWFCDCSTTILRNIFQVQGIVIACDPVCATPPGLRNMTWSSLGNLCDKEQGDAML